MSEGQSEAHVVAALKARRDGAGAHTPVPSRSDLSASIRLAHASAARRAIRTARKTD